MGWNEMEWKKMLGLHHSSLGKRNPSLQRGGPWFRGKLPQKGLDRYNSIEPNALT